MYWIMSVTAQRSHISLPRDINVIKKIRICVILLFSYAAIRSESWT